MSIVHRPLSDWIARLVPPLAGTTDVPGLDVINDGDERSDAREFPMFASGWLRRRVAVADRSGHVREALALHHPETDATFVELDDYGIPISISEAAVTLVDRIEQSWPDAQLTNAELELLGTESLELRYYLLDRLAREGRPPSALFHVLPWSLVEDVARATIALLNDSASSASRDPRHWLTPAMSGVTGPLEQLHQGLVDDESELARAGATALCEGLSAVELARVPPSTADTLADLLRTLGELNPLLRHKAAVVAGRLATPENQHREFRIDLDSGLPSAASSNDTGLRFHSERAHDDPLTVNARTTAGGRLTIVVEVAIDAGPGRDRLLASYRTAFFPLTIESVDGSDRYWVPLEERRNGLAGVLELRTPRERFQIHADGPPVGVWELSVVDARDLLPSLNAADNAGAEIWQQLAEQLPARNPITQAWSTHGDRGER